MDATVTQYFLTQGPFAVLFVWLFYSSRKEAREREQENRHRENQLYKTIENQNEILNKFSEKYDVVINQLSEIKDRLPPK
ncbi:SPBc2 prophage-derived protein BhlA [Heyndrickxia sporothermodurans]|nr:SPBc2 prophage-derived protein BhlA [Heyndrickxia sporothermodurans]